MIEGMIEYNENTISILKNGHYSVYDYTLGDEVVFDDLEECKHYIDRFLYID